MYNHSIPSKDELPSTGQLIRSTIFAAVVAVLLLLTVVMPAEYAIDPTGAGRMLGLMQMGEIKEQLAEEAAADAAMTHSSQSSIEPASEKPELAEVPAAIVETPEVAEEKENVVPEWKDEISFVLTPGQGTEYKLTMEEGAIAHYSWISDGGPINFDAHGNGSGKSISYEKGRGVPSDEGDLTAAFKGEHGWFFRNRNKNDVTVTLKTKGDYGKLKKLI